jgi:hypothetical protein
MTLEDVQFVVDAPTGSTTPPVNNQVCFCECMQGAVKPVAASSGAVPLNH